MNFFSLLFVIIVYMVNKSLSKIITNNINTNINWLYLTKFYFHPISGHIDINFNSIDDTMKFFVLNKRDWNEMKMNLLNICLNEELSLTQVKNETNLWILSSSFISIDRMYFILYKCNSSSNITDSSIAFKLILTNGNNLFTEHFSDDERGILELFIVSTSLYTIILLIVLKYLYFSKTKSCLITKFYLISILFSWLNSLLSFIDALIFALTGTNQIFSYRLFLFLIRFCHLNSQILFLLILILCAKGHLIRSIRLKKKIIVEITIIMLLYIHMKVGILIVTTIFANQDFVYENLFLICDYIQMMMYFLTCLWFIGSLLFTIKKSNKKFYFFLIFSIWFLMNGIVILLNILDILPNPQITILKAMEISIQYLLYCIFLFIIRREIFSLQTKLNQINITYIDPTLSQVPIKEQSTTEREIDTNSCEFTNLCYVENSWASRYPMPIQLPRLEPRRDVLFRALTKSSVILSQPSICPVPRRLPPLKHDNP